MVNQPTVILVIESQDPLRLRAAKSLAAKLQLPIQTKLDSSQLDEHSLILALRDETLELRDPSTKPGHGLIVDFSTLHPKQSARRGNFSRNQPLARAIGKNTRTVLDATAGLGHDSALLACMNFNVIAVERSPIIAALLQDGLRRALLDPDLTNTFADRLTIINADAREFLNSPSLEGGGWGVGEEPRSSQRANLQISNPTFASSAPSAVKPRSNLDVEHFAIYIDPMFPPKRKSSALAKKSIRLVRQIVGDDPDAIDLLHTARQHAPRVIVKRPNHAPPLAPNPTATINANLVRYDVYKNSPSLEGGG